LARESLTCGAGAARYLAAIFDLVISRDALHYIASGPSRFRTLRDAARVLKFGGTLVVIDRGSVQPYLRLLNDVGLTVTERRPESLMILPRLEVLIARRSAGLRPGHSRPIGKCVDERTVCTLTPSIAF
jgi:ubiquinone/menaquinone biosynthesis C-methylase UbiE